MNNDKVTLAMMARRLDVSTATVSNAFNRPDQLSTELRQRILDECERAGYAGPSPGRRRGRQAVLGLMLDRGLGEALGDPETQALIHGLSGELDRRHYSLLLLPAHTGNGTPQLPSLDGLLYYRRAGERLDRLPDARVIALECSLVGCPSVRVDEYAGGRAAALHGLKAGGADAAILGRGLVDSDRVCRVREEELEQGAESPCRQRLRGYLDGLESRGGGRARERIWHLPDGAPATARQAVREALGCSPRPQLLLCMDDGIAAVALEVAAETGLRVPDQLRVVGFGGRDAGALTTVVPEPPEARGRLAARMFFGEAPRQEHLLVPRLVPGASCP